MNDIDRYDCGCVMWNEGEKLYFQPHDAGCKVARLVYEESRKRGNEIIERHVDDRPTLRSDAGACPHCRKRLTGHQGISDEDARPESGDFVVCFGCAEILVFDAEMQVRAANVEEQNEALSDELFADFVRKLKARGA